MNKKEQAAHMHRSFAKDYLVIMRYDRMTTLYFYPDHTKQEIMTKLAANTVGESCTDIEFKVVSKDANGKYFLCAMKEDHE